MGRYGGRLCKRDKRWCARDVSDMKAGVTVFQHGESQASLSSLSRSDSGSSGQSMVHGGTPELFLGLAYNGTTGRLSAQVIKGSNFKNLATSRAPGQLLISGLSFH